MQTFLMLFSFSFVRMVNFAQINAGMNVWFENVKKNIQFTSKFVLLRIRNYKNDTRIEQIMYPVVGLGLILVLVSLVMFIF